MHKNAWRNVTKPRNRNWRPARARKGPLDFGAASIVRCIVTCMVTSTLAVALSAGAASAQPSPAKSTDRAHSSNKPGMSQKLANVVTLAEAPNQIRETLEHESFEHGLTVSYGAGGPTFVGPGFTLSVGRGVVDSAGTTYSISSQRSRAGAVTAYGQGPVVESFDPAA